MVKKTAGATLEVPCIGECGEIIVVKATESAVVQKVEWVCAKCSKQTKWKMESKNTDGARVIPAGQTRFGES